MIIRKSIVLEKKDCEIVQSLIRRKGLGVRGFSPALRIIIREWQEMNDNHNSSNSKSVPTL